VEDLRQFHLMLTILLLLVAVAEVHSQVAEVRVDIEHLLVALHSL
jgi:hypothetical protein